MQITSYRFSPLFICVFIQVVFGYKTFEVLGGNDLHATRMQIIGARGQTVVEPYNKGLRRILSPCYNTLLQWAFAAPPFNRWSLFSHPLHLSSHDDLIWPKECGENNTAISKLSLNQNFTFLKHSCHHVRKPRLNLWMMTDLVEKEYQLTVTPRSQTVNEAILDTQAPVKPPEDCSLTGDLFGWLEEELPDWIIVSSH